MPYLAPRGQIFEIRSVYSRVRACLEEYLAVPWTEDTVWSVSGALPASITSTVWLYKSWNVGMLHCYFSFPLLAPSAPIGFRITFDLKETDTMTVPFFWRRWEKLLNSLFSVRDCGRQTNWEKKANFRMTLGAVVDGHSSWNGSGLTKQQCPV